MDNRNYRSRTPIPIRAIKDRQEVSRSEDCSGCSNATAEEPSIATWLLQNRLHADDHVAVIGDGTGAYLAHLAQLRIIAEIPAASAPRPGCRQGTSGNLLLSCSKSVEHPFSKGALIAAANASILDAPPSRISSQWIRVGETRAYVYFF
jgi:hypothetical protein